ncbi:putative disease resistance protein At3g14460 [Zingiber officinale]|uniref:putative disease resistance protein At3g14460 n=1 Tax=Zingiber officinale TaxID=94328 RepID=UPI001C4C0359|nr:putative disease resistance protein At3g14460 [Zingiber officinale]
MSLFAETPQFEIATYLSKLLEERTYHVIESLRQHQDLEVYNAIAILERLREILPKILRKPWKLRTDNFHTTISNKFLEDWLCRFKGFFYMTEDVFDDLDIIVLPSDKRQGDYLSAFGKRMLICKKAIAKLPEVIDAATGLLGENKNLMEGMREFEQILYRRWKEQQVTSSELPTLPYKVRELKGRAGEEKKILEALLHKEEGESKKSTRLIRIAGPVGIGKTELARAVYNSAQVEAEFDVRAWIYMGNHHRDDNWLTLQRSEPASVDKSSKLQRLNGLAIFNIFDTLERELQSKKVLIVLDNLADKAEHSSYLGTFRSFRATEDCRIIVTTQFEYVGRVNASLNVELDGLEEEEYLELFKECAALGDKNHDKYPAELENTCKEIAKRFGGNPLAAVMIGRHLKWHQSEDRWRVISRSNLGMIDPTESNIISVLKHSYEELTGNQKQCYLACALFPKNYPFKQNQLFEIWKAIGCCSHTSNQWSWAWTDIEPFFVSSARKDGEFILHAIFHELADYICDGDFFRLEDEIKEEDGIEIPDKARHVYVTADNFVKIYKVLQEKTHLRSLVICGVLSSKEHKSSFMGLLEEVLQNLEGLRLLMISVLPTGKLPDAIGSLRHLRYLELPIDKHTLTKESFLELPTWISDDGFAGLRKLQNLEELRGAIQKLKTGESSHSFKSIGPELSYRESSDPSDQLFRP